MAITMKISFAFSYIIKGPILTYQSGLDRNSFYLHQVLVHYVDQATGKQLMEREVLVLEIGRVGKKDPFGGGDVRRDCCF